MSRRELEGGLARGARWRGFSYCRLLREWDPFLQQGLNQAWWPPFHLRRRQPILEGAEAASGTDQAPLACLELPLACCGLPEQIGLIAGRNKLGDLWTTPSVCLGR